MYIYILQSFQAYTHVDFECHFMPYVLSQHQVHQELMSHYEVHFTSLIPRPHPKKSIFRMGPGNEATLQLCNSIALRSPCKVSQLL